MANGFLVIDEKDWKELTPERRDWLIFNTLKSLDIVTGKQIGRAHV